MLFYHSNTKPPHVAGVARIAKEGYRISHRGIMNASILMKNRRQKCPRWFMVDIEPVLELNMVSLHEMKENPKLWDAASATGPAAVRPTRRGCAL